MRKRIGYLLCLILLSYCFGGRAYAQNAESGVQNLSTENPAVLSPEAILRQKALKNPQDLESARKLLDVYQQSGRLRTANRFLNQIINLNPNLPLDFLQRGVNNSLAAKDYLKVVQFTRMVNAKDPQNAENLNSMGFALYNLKQYGVARGAFEISVHLDPQNYRALTNLARDLEALGNTQKAQDLYQKALVINPNYQLAKRNLAKLQNPVLKNVPSNHLVRKKTFGEPTGIISPPSSKKSLVVLPQNTNSSQENNSAIQKPTDPIPKENTGNSVNSSEPQNTPLTTEEQKNNGQGEKN